MKLKGSGYFFIYPFISIGFITDDRKSNRCEVYSDLVSPPCFYFELQEWIMSLNIRYKLTMSNSYLGIDWILSGHLHPIIWMTSYVWFYGKFLLFHYTSYDSEIVFIYFPILDLFLKRFHHTITLCYHDSTWSIFIKSMNYSWSFYPIYEW